MTCPLCTEPGGLLIFQAADWRLVRVTDTPAHPAFYRVIMNAHVAEFSQLSVAQRQGLMEAVAAVEAVLLQHLADLAPAKVNLASLGNVVPHLHWHVVARWTDDAQWPAPVWATALRETPAAVLAARRAALPGMDAALGRALAPSL